MATRRIHRKSKNGPEPTLKDRSCAGLSVGHDLGKLYLEYLSCPTPARLNTFLECCMRRLANVINYIVRRQGICPRSAAPATFAQDAYSRACEKFWSGIHALHTPEGLAKWTKQVAHSAVVEELYTITRRTKQGQCLYSPLQVEQPDGNVTDILDRAENRDAAHRYAGITIEQTELVKQLVYHEILGKLFRADIAVSKRDRDGIQQLERMLNTGLTVEDIAAERGWSKPAVSQLLRSARKRLRKIAETRYQFTADDL